MSEQKRQLEQKRLSGQLKPSQSVQSILKGSPSKLKFEDSPSVEVQPKKTGWFKKGSRQPLKHTDFQIIVQEKRARHGYYFRTMCLFVANNLTHIMLGAVNIVVLRYAVRNKDAHAFMCTFGYHFLCAEAILSLHRVNLWSAPMYLRHRKRSHFYIQVVGIFTSFFGSLIIVYEKQIGPNVTFHSITGFLTLLILLLTACVGPGAFIYTHAARIMKIVHISVALPTFVLSSLCLISGLLKPNFKNHVTTSMPAILVSFVIFYTLFIFFTVFHKFLDRIHRTFK